MLLAHEPAGDALEAVHQGRHGDLGRIVHQQMHMVILAIHLDQLRLALRAEEDWLKAAPIHTLQQALKDLDRAYRNFFAGRAAYPTPRKRGVNDSFRFPDPTSLRVERTGRSSGRIKLPKFAWVRLRGGCALPGDIRNITLCRRAGQWFAAVPCEREVAEPVPSVLPAVGIDMGVAVFAALSDGAGIAPANHGKKALRALRKAQRDLARKKRGSANRRKTARRMARIQQRVANARKDFLHKHSTTIAKNHGMVVMEASQVRNMSASAAGTVEEPGRNVRRKAGLNRAILDQGWSMFRVMLAYKLAGCWRRQQPTPARHARCAAVPMPQTGAIRRRSSVSAVAIRPMPTPTPAPTPAPTPTPTPTPTPPSTFYGARIAR